MGYSITIGVSYPVWKLGDDFSPGHVAATLNLPDYQRYVGFGPLKDGSQWLNGISAFGKFDVQDVSHGTVPAYGHNDFSTVVGHGSAVFFRLEGTESQALTTDIWIYTQQQRYLLDELGRDYSARYNEYSLGSDGQTLSPSFSWDQVGTNYSPGLVCSNMGNNALQAWTNSNNVLFPTINPTALGSYLSDVADALARDPNTLFVMHGDRPLRIPDELRGLQRIDSPVEPRTGSIGDARVAGIDYIPQAEPLGQITNGNGPIGIGRGWNDPQNLQTVIVGNQFTAAQLGRPQVPGIDFVDPTNPLTANGVMQDFSFTNGMLLNTQSGQIAFGSPNGLSSTSTDWASYFGNNNIGSLDFGGLNQTAASSWYDPYIPTSNDYSFNPGFSWDEVNFSYPVVLDLTGAGINITELGSSGQFVDMTGDGYKNRTAWAGAGNGVLVFDVNGNGIVDSANEFEFTAWDPTAASDMQALRDVFDTNHDGRLDAGDTNFAAFKVLVTNADGTITLRTLAELGIVSINLTTDNYRNVLADGSVIAGRTTFTRADGSTGTAADVSLAYDANGYATQQAVTHNADGSTTNDVRALNRDGSLASETVTTTSADGLSRVLEFDHSGNGVFDQTQTIVVAVNADGSRTSTISNFDVTGTLGSRTVTTTSLDGATVTIARDLDGNGVTDQSELRVTNADGSRTITVSDLNVDGSLRHRTVTTTSRDGLTQLVQTDSAGAGVFDQTRRDVTVVAADGSRVETITDSNRNGSLRDRSVTATSADGRDKTTQSDLDGDGTFDRTVVSSIVAAADSSLTTTQTDRNGDGSVLIDRTVTSLSADGLSKTESRDLDGNGTFDVVTSDVTVRNADGSASETVTDRNADGALRDRTVSLRGADGRSRTVQADSNGDGVNDRVETIVIAADGSSTDAVSSYNPNGSLRARTVTTASADGLATMVHQDNTGSGSFDRTHTDVIVVNADGSRAETIIDSSADGSLLASSVMTTSADRLTVITQSDSTGSGTFSRTRTDVTVLNGDGSRTETVTDRNSDGSLHARTVVTTSADRLTVSTTVDANGDGHVDRTSSRSVSAAGITVADVADRNADGTLRDRTVTTTSADGLSTATQSDLTGAGSFERTRTDVTVLNADGSRTETISDLSNIGSLLKPEILLRQSRIFYRDQQPRGVPSWTMADDIVAKRWTTSDSGRRSGRAELTRASLMLSRRSGSKAEMWARCDPYPTTQTCDNWQCRSGYESRRTLSVRYEGSA